MFFTDMQEITCFTFIISWIIRLNTGINIIFEVKSHTCRTEFYFY